MSVAWTIKRANGEERTMTEWGLGKPTRTLINQGIDQCVFRFVNAELASDGIAWNDLELITVLRDGATWFAGTLLPADRDARGRSFDVSLTVAGPWFWLENLVYEQKRAWVTGQTVYPTLPYPLVNADGTVNTLTADQQAANYLAVANPASYPNVVIATSVLLLNQLDTGATCATDVFITQVLNYAISKGAPFQLGTIDPGITVPLEEIRDLMCAEVIRRQLQWTPDQVPWFDYTTTPPTIHITSRANRAALTITAPDDCPSAIKLKACRDLLVPGVTINYITPEDRTGLTFYTLAQDKAGVTDGLFALSATLELMGGAVVDQAGTVFYNGEPPPTGLAAALLAGYGFLHYQGSVEVVAQECPGGNYLSKVLNVAGGSPDWVSMRAFIQKQTDTLFDGHTVIDVGPPTHLSPSNLLARLRALRNFQPVTNLGYSRMTGSAALGSPAANNPPPTQPVYNGPVGSTDPSDVGLPTTDYDEYVIGAVFTSIEQHGTSKDTGEYADAGPAAPPPQTPDYSGPVRGTDFTASTDFLRQNYNNGFAQVSRSRWIGLNVIAKYDFTGLGPIAAGSRFFLIGTQTLSLSTGTGVIPDTATSAAHMEFGGTATGSVTVTAKPGAVYGDPATGAAFYDGSVSYTAVRVYSPAPL